MQKVDHEEKAVVVANLIYSYDTVRAAAAEVLKLPQFNHEDRLQKLQYTRPWCKGYLRRNALRPRRITAQEKELTPPETVQERMREIEDVSIAGEYAQNEVLHGDETGTMYGAQPKLQYVPLDATRAMAPDGDTKARFTTFLFGDTYCWEDEAHVLDN